MGRIQVSIDELPYATDNGFTDTISTLIDVFAFAGRGRRYEYIDIPSQLGMIQKKVLIKPLEVLDLLNEILAMGFEKVTRKSMTKVKGNYEEDINTLYINYSNKDYSIIFNARTYYFSIMCQHSAILGKAKAEIIQDIKNLFQYEFGVEDKYIQNLDRAIKLGRIDFKRDHRYKDEQHLALLKYIIEIAPESIGKGNYQKYDERDEHLDIEEFDDIEYMKKFKSESNKTVEFVIYDKYLERLDKYKQGLITQEELEQYEHLIRFECRIKNEKLNNLRRKENWALDKDIDNYKDENVADELFDYYAEQAFFQEPMYRLDVAKRKIRNVDDETLTPYKKKECRKILNDINKKGYTRAKEEYQFPSTFGDRVKEIRALGINILTFPTTWVDREGNIHKTTYTSIPNPIKKSNCILEDDYVIPSRYWKLVEQAKSKKVIDIS